MAVTTTPKTVGFLDEGVLNLAITATDVTLTLAPIYKYVSGVKTKQGFNSLTGIALVSLGDRTEKISFDNRSVDANFVTTYSITRGLSQTTAATASFTGGTGLAWPKGAKFQVIVDNSYFQNAVFADTANTFTATQTITELDFGGTSAYIKTTDAGTNIKFKDGSTAEVTLSTLAAAAGTDHKVLVTSNDTTADFLYNKLAAGAGITVTETNDGGNEDATIAAVNTVDTGHTGLSTVTTGGLLIGAGTSNMTIIGPGSNGQIPVSNGTTIAMGSPSLGFFGTGADGTPNWAAGVSLNPSTTKSYVTATLPVSQTLTVSSVNTPLIISTQGDVTINGTIDLLGKGGAGAAGRTNTGTGATGTSGNSAVSTSLLNTNGGAGGTNATTDASGGGGGGNFSTAGATASNVGGSTGGAGGAVAITAVSAMLTFAQMVQLTRGVICGAGGGAGGYGSTATGTSGAGGAGGGAMVWYIGGNLTLGSASVIRCSGAAGTNAAGTNVLGGGGGGAAGQILIVVAGTITDGGTTLAAAGGAGSTGTGGGSTGGAGAAGRIQIYSLSTGTYLSA